MKKEICMALGVLLSMVIPRQGYADSEARADKRFWGGISLGGGFVEFVGDGIESPQTSGGLKPGITLGGHISYVFHPRIAVNAEVLFAMKGSYHLGDGERLGFYTLNYLELPLLADITLFSIRDKIFPFVALGPAVSFLLSASGEDLRQGEPLDLDGVYKTVDLGVIFAAGAAVPITSSHHLSLEARYDMGLRAVQPNRDTINNRGILLMLSYQTCICSRDD